ncbi:geranylgeranyl transferase type 2 alpha [Grosmannia clavigera kw1407]|uniref:Geranylgeranyl transferase type-2 subunit alpha n=1 Tax=Grosmannia clavigera (strain kw1407 / UAMH 11150) TaxID=655863 RepID=F0XV40_GROCL|nr:geranylgeranyl transferase type 2 alpha [Grosmannia clavigera kw1407]EFW98990.1 geranylgeranyl transferase type 2 alpha [Grosmannia clavigera kw1407]
MASHGVARGPRTRTDDQKRQDAERIKTYRELEDQLRLSDGHGTDAFQLTTKLLRLNPEYYTIWNVRRRCLISGSLSRWPSGSPSSEVFSSLSPSRAILLSSGGSLSTSSAATPPSRLSTGETSGESSEGAEVGEEGGASKVTSRAADHANDARIITAELQFTIPLLMEFPKCYWIWSYRLWVLQQAVQRLEAQTARRIWEDELALDSKMLTKDRRNFHAWGYRRQVVEQLESPALSPAGAGGPPTSLVEAEFAYTTKMVHMDLSNFSAWHSRSKLIPRLLEERQADDLARTHFLDSELGIVREALNVGPEDQSLWFYHQFLMSNLIDYIGRPTITPHFSHKERMTYVVRELDDIKDLLLDYDDIKWIYEALLEYTIAVAKMEERPLAENEIIEARAWLAKLRELDPMRGGRWDDLEAEYILRRRRPFAEDGLDI